MALTDRFWVTGGTGNWTSSTNWSTTSGGASGAGQPNTNASRAIFDANSGTGTVTHNAATTLHSFDASAAGALTFASSGASRTFTMGGAGNNNGAAVFKLASGQTWTGAETAITIDNEFGGFTIDTNGVSLSSATGWNVGAGNTQTITLGSDFNIGTNTFTRNDTATLNLNGKTMTCGTYVGLNGATITFGAGTMSLGVGNGWQPGSTETVNANTGTITITAANALFAGLGKTYNNLTMNAGGSMQLTGANTFNGTVTVTSTAVFTDNLTISANNTMTLISFSGNSVTNRLLIQSNTTGTARTLTVTTVTLAQNVDFMDITISGLTLTGTSLGNCLGNSGITFTTPVDQYLVGTGSRNWSASTWSATSGGLTATGRVPLPQDNVFIDANSGTGTVTIDLPRSGANHNYGSGSALTLSYTVVGFSLYGNITLGTSLTYTITASTFQTLRGRGAQTITTNGKQWGTLGSKVLNVNAPGGTYTLQDNFTSGSQVVSVAGTTLTLTNGTFTANNFTVGIGAVNVLVGTTINGGTGKWTLNQIIVSVWSVTGSPTVNCSTTPIFLNDTGGFLKQFTGGGNTYGDITIAPGGAGSVDFIDGNTFNSITMSSAGTKTVHFTAGTTTTLTGGASSFLQGTAGNLITITGVTSAVWTLASSTKIVTDYLNLSYSTASGAIPFNYGIHTTDSGNNTNWNNGLSDSGELTLLGVG